MMIRVRVLIAPEDFDGTLTAAQAAQALAEGWLRHAPDDELDLCPMSDGGPGFVAALHAALPGRLIPLEVPGPLGEPALAAFLLAGDTAYLEAAQACGLGLLSRQSRDPGRATSRGVGVLIAAALAAGARRIVVGLGGSASNDGGAGMLAGLAQALRVEDADRLTTALGAGGLGLSGITAERVPGLAALVEQLAGVELVAATDADVTLLGFKGTSAMFAAAKGAAPEQAQALDLAISDFARVSLQLTGRAQRLVAEAGAGADGGLGFGLLLLGARREPGAATVARAVGLPERLSRVDLAITGEGMLDWQSLRGKVLTVVAELAQQVAVPTVAVAGQVLVGRRELLSVGVESAYPVARTPAEIARSLAHPAARLADRAERVARTWSPRPPQPPTPASASA